MSVEEHRRDAPGRVRCAVITISDTRTPDTDSSGRYIVDALTAAGHDVRVRTIVPDEPERIRASVLAALDDSVLDVVLTTGGTGITRRDGTYEVITSLLEKPLEGFGELFRMLSYQDIGAAAMLSRACGGLVRGRIVLAMPGSEAAVRLALDKLILPELSHLVREARR